jgi:hypothetical protein
MAGFYQTFTSTRATEPDAGSLLSQLRALDASAGVSHTPATSVYVIKKATPWSQGQINAAQNVIDTAPAASPQLTAQNEIDRWPISVKALVLALIDQLNVIRAALPTPLPAITPAQALAAIRTKAGTL